MAMLFGIVVPASHTLYVRESGPTTVETGMWLVVTCSSDKCTEVDTVDMLAALYGATDCGDAMAAKIETCRAFSILGVMGIAVTAGLLFSPAPWFASAGAAGFASFSYMLVFAIAAAL